MKYLKLILPLFLLNILSNVVSAQQNDPDFEWAVSIGGEEADRGRSMAVDKSGNIYLTGYFQSTAQFGNITLISNGGIDIYVMKMNAEGEVLWAVNAGSEGHDYGRSLSLDEDGNCYITGYFSETASFGNFQIESSGYRDIFIAKLNPSGGFVWAFAAGSKYEDDSGLGIATSKDGHVYVTGYFYDDGIFGDIEVSNESYYAHVFIAKMSQEGEFIWVQQVEGSSESKANAIAVDNTGNIYITGYYYGTTAEFGSFTKYGIGYRDVFVAKLDTNGQFLWALNTGEGDEENSESIAVDNFGNVYISGYYYGFTSFGGYELESAGSNDMFLVCMDTSLSIKWVKSIGGNKSDKARGVATDAEGNCYLLGYYRETIEFDGYELTSKGSVDVFVAKLDSLGNYLWYKSAGGVENDYCRGIAVDDKGLCYITGMFRDSASFGNFWLESRGDDDGFIAKIHDPEMGTNINKINVFENLRIYPNPTSTQVVIEVMEKDFNTSVSIVDLSGRVVMQKKITQSQTVINTSTLNSGIYFLQIDFKGRRTVKKIVKN